MFIFVSVFVALLVLVLIKYKRAKCKVGFTLLIPVLLLSSTYFIFDNTFFRVLNLFVIPGLIFAMIIMITDEKEKEASFVSKFWALLFGGIELVDDVGESLKWSDENTTFKKVMKGIVFSLPLVLIIIVLLASADSVFYSIFGTIAENFFAGSLPVNIVRLALVGVLFFYFAGFMLNIVENDTKYNDVNKVQRKMGIEISRFNVNVALTMLNIIYLIFSVIQFTFLFTDVAAAEGFNHASYARQGFFQLTLVSLINIVMIYVSTVNEGNEDTDVSEVKSKKYAKIMNVLMCGFTVVIIISSFYRMHLYEAAFGYTYLRLFVYFILITELIMMVPTVMFILGARLKLLRSYILIFAAMYLVINFANIDRLIARRNIDRYFGGNTSVSIDAWYLRDSVGVDALLQMERLLDSSDERARRAVYDYFRYHNARMERRSFSWQEANISRSRARMELRRIMSSQRFREVSAEVNSRIELDNRERREYNQRIIRGGDFYEGNW